MKCASAAAILSNISANGDVLLLVFFFFVEFFWQVKDADTHGECIKSFQNARFFVEIKQLVLADDFLFVNWRILATNSCFFPTNVWPMKLICGVERIPTKYEFR